MSSFSISKFESAFYYFLYRNFTVDLTEFHRKMLYNGMTLQVNMSNSRITSIVDISGIAERVLFSIKGAKND